MAKIVIHDEQGNAKWGDQDHLEAAANTSFTQMIFELLSEKVPSPEELRLFELILNLSIDHGDQTPSAVKVIELANQGKSVSESVAGGILEINDSHGGAGQPLMELLYQIKAENLAVTEVVAQYLSEGKRLPGLGHRLYKGDDPRVLLIFKEAESGNIGAEFISLLLSIQNELEKQKGTRLPINIDGAIAVILCSFGWDPKLGKVLFIIARTPGLCGQYLNHTQK
jgi:citrate synthase